ncbi:helix-turn-helix domain-containing protein [Mucilaginibacter flavidus]|uniref:helix-turn-helix domain-containing protein n=1 Tax=Mucilaginibacter flavidus TaxID=2949309 RepID=UPI002093C090|nr:AraC family transcriptional regulator [Mucilaginibacter flavidus]
MLASLIAGNYLSTVQLSLNIIVILLAVVISQSLFAAGLLWFAPTNRRSGRILTVLITAIALWLSDDFMRIGLIYRQRPNLYFLPIFYSFGFGPLIWFYLKSLIQQNFRFKRADLLHFIPVALQAGLYFFLTFCSYPVKSWYWENVHRQYTYRIEFDGTWISMTIYLVLSFRLLRHYQVWVANNFSDLSRIRLNWLKVILGILLLLCLQWFVEIILRDVYGVYFNYDYSVEILGVIALVLGVAGLQQASLSEVSYEPESTVVYETDPAILERISRSMEQDRLYLNPTLTLLELSAALKLNSKIVSRHINVGFGKSFNDYVNSYRVEEVKRRLKSGDLAKLTIMGLAMESGFNSKTTFNRIFKSFTGHAPSEFITD